MFDRFGSFILAMTFSVAAYEYSRDDATGFHGIYHNRKRYHKNRIALLLHQQRISEPLEFSRGLT